MTSCILHNDLCRICEFGGDLLCCDSCNQVFHVSCLIPLIDKLPVGDWFCQWCVLDDPWVQKYKKSQAGKYIKKMLSEDHCTQCKNHQEALESARQENPFAEMKEEMREQAKVKKAKVKKVVSSVATTNTILTAKTNDMIENEVDAVIENMKSHGKNCNTSSTNSPDDGSATTLGETDDDEGSLDLLAPPRIKKAKRSTASARCTTTSSESSEQEWEDDDESQDAASKHEYEYSDDDTDKKAAIRKRDRSEDEQENRVVSNPKVYRLMRQTHKPLQDASSKANSMTDPDDDGGDGLAALQRKIREEKELRGNTSGGNNQAAQLGQLINCVDAYKNGIFKMESIPRLFRCLNELLYPTQGIKKDAWVDYDVYTIQKTEYRSFKVDDPNPQYAAFSDWCIPQNGGYLINKRTWRQFPIYSLTWESWHIHPTLQKNRYPSMTTTKETKMDMVIHKAVAMLWGLKRTEVAQVGTIDSMVVDHIVEGHKWNYAIDNLEWRNIGDNIRKHHIEKKKPGFLKFPMTGTWVKSCSSTEDYGEPDLSFIDPVYDGDMGSRNLSKPYHFNFARKEMGIKFTKKFATVEEFRKAVRETNMSVWK